MVQVGRLLIIPFPCETTNIHTHTHTKCRSPLKHANGMFGGLQTLLSESVLSTSNKYLVFLTVIS